MELDSTDRLLLNLLQENALLTVREMAEKVHLSITPVHDRIKKLENQGIIEKYVALVNRKRIGRAMMVYCFVTLDKQRREGFQEFNEAIRQLPEILECSVVSGNFDYLLKIVVADMEAYNTFYQSKLSVLSSVSHMSSSFVMEEVKSTTLLNL
ncbi:Lrp/AsnC family transcriptional regulator [Siphonobacter aquaeclarae]|jgi:Lrp/AsnC family leucine-responsive transcriptional regulator|uniref:Lrp/AsnC family transcriptional regulator n=1 Tax=Siphonobacter aquaeclarae TaxID=563176 RepID=A0A1G9UG46_9BACT|nr:Lrp/AsnC family transcriptional regulator [Siphonobacter aquaeclarae]MBO9636536.1 Lrp/AsnC family transcriptional regulator [Siphonobacter aquaeclarae]SDM58930.1 Lrp/AsnC family transcriptional regulator [Siphonobacter aquaeclarae]